MDGQSRRGCSHCNRSITADEIDIDIKGMDMKVADAYKRRLVNRPNAPFYCPRCFFFLQDEIAKREKGVFY